jgi:hypothetical protein
MPDAFSLLYHSTIISIGLPHSGSPVMRSTISQEDFMSQVSSFFWSENKMINPPLFIFKRCHLAAAHNTEILSRFDFDLDRILRLQHLSQISYGSEFRPSQILETSLTDHPLWGCLKDILKNGANFPLEPISDEHMAIDLAYHRDRGNHKSLSKYATFIDPIISDDIECGFTLPLPIQVLDKIPNSSLPL